jgi:NitT/TauT family transport system substrate-binding protein
MIDRRGFLRRATAAGAVAAIGLRARRASAQPPPETTRIRLARVPSICRAPQYMTEDLLRAEGFTDVQYLSWPDTTQAGRATAAGDVDITMQYVGPSIVQIDAGEPLVFLAGVQPGCFELFGTGAVRSIRDLKGKTVAVDQSAGSAYTFTASMMTSVGLDPRRDVTWARITNAEAKQQLAAGKIDAFLALPPDPQERRARKIGHVIVNSVTDRPWSQYFCCIAVGHRDFVRRNPVATKRTVRAILKAADACAADPERAARFLVDKGYTERYDYALQALRDIPYNKWREYDHEDTVRFYTLRLHEAGMIRSTPKKILEHGTDWRFLNELKKELKS